LALLLAGLGLYGVIAYSVTQRTQEIGIRIAVGAQRRDVLDLILRGGVKLAVVGVVLGLIGALGLSRILESLLYGVSAYDPLIYLGNAAVLLAVAAIACIVPALRATKVDPIVALRAD
jgi:putative ABC transport system permease protein